MAATETVPDAEKRTVVSSAPLPQMGKETIDLNTAEGRARIDALIAQGVLRMDDVSTVVSFRKER